jgi:hypothetical protein
MLSSLNDVLKLLKVSSTWEGFGSATKTLCTQKEDNAFSLRNNNLGYQGILEYAIKQIFHFWHIIPIHLAQVTNVDATCVCSRNIGFSILTVTQTIHRDERPLCLQSKSPEMFSYHISPWHLNREHMNHSKIP